MTLAWFLTVSMSCLYCVTEVHRLAFPIMIMLHIVAAVENYEVCAVWKIIIRRRKLPLIKEG